ncbi:MAG: hypothetical protein QW369_03700 [Desulfurococcaceae archaeon]
MLSGLTTVITYILSRKTSLILFTVLISTALSTLSLYAIGYIESLYRIYDVFYPIDRGSAFTITVSSDAVSPFTSIVDLEYIEDRLRDFKDVSIQPVFITIGLLGAEPVVVYEFNYANDTCAYPDQAMLSNIKAMWGDFIPIQSPFNSEILFLKVCGVGGRPGIGVSHATIARLRGVSLNYYSFVVVYVYNNDVIDDVYKALGLERVEPYVEKLVKRAFLIAIRRGNIVELKSVQNPTEAYLVKLGIYRDYLVYLAYSIALVTLVGLPLIGLGLVSFLHRDFEIFIVHGVSRRTLMASLLAFTAISTGLSIAISVSVLNLGITPRLTFMGYNVPFKIDLEDAVYVALSNYSLCILGSTWRLMEFES